ncbi:MAG: porin [Beijerinckiaceae bacterium]|nr:MAG: porin [Beijerinckiaceae bacterium]
MKAILKRGVVVLPALVCLVQAAYAADLPTARPSSEPSASSSCLSSLWNWLGTSVADCPLTYGGFTLYGTLDAGFGYNTAGVGFGKWYDKGVFYTVQKTSGAGRWSWSPNGLSASTLGVKMEEPIGANWLLIGAAEMAFNSFSLLPDNGPKSLADNNLNSPSQQTANGDSSRAGQWDNSLGFVGVSNATYGTLTVGRMISLSNDVAVAYDPTRSNAFSLIGNSGPFPRYGYPELVRVDTGLQYRVEFGNFRLASLAQVGDGYALGNGSMGEYEVQIGTTFGGFSADAVLRYARDAVSLQSFSGSDVPAGYNPASILQATLADVTAILVAARYKWDNSEIYGGYTYARLANPSDAFPNGFATIAPGIFVPPGEANATFYDVNQILQTVWIGAKYNVRANLSVAANFTYQHQNDFLQAPATCTGFGASTSSPKCAGGQSAIAFLVDYNPLPRIDLYGGVMISNVYGGLASGYFKTQNIDPTIGLRTRF